MRHKLSRRIAALVGAAVTVLATACTVPEGTEVPPAPAITSVGAPVPAGRLTAPPPLDDVLHDQGTPITLPDGRTMWIFADTADLFTGPLMFLTSSAAFSEAEKPNDLRFFVGADGRPAELLPRRANEMPTSATSYDGLWPMGATELPDGRILIAYSKYYVTLSPITFTFKASGLFEYRYPGYPSLAAPVRATRLADDLWTAADGPVNSPVYANGYVYFVNCDGVAYCFSLRATPDKLTDRDSYEWWQGDGWGHALTRKPMVFGGHLPGRSPTVQWVPALGAYAMADTVLGAPTTSGLLWLAAQPQGPWSEPIEYPLANCGVRGCYLPNVQPQASTASSLRIAYSSGGTWGPTIWTIDLPVTATVAQRYQLHPQPVLLGDTRTGEGMLAIAPLEDGGWRHVSISRPDQPSNLSTAIVAIEVADAAAPVRLRVGPSGTFRPGEVVEVPAGTSRHQVEVTVGPNNRIALTNEDATAVDLTVELVGYSTAA